MSTFLKRMLWTVESASMALYDPYRGDMVAKLGEVSGEYACIILREKMKTDPVGRRILNERPLIDSSKLSIENLLKLSNKTLGYHYGMFMKDNNITSDTREPVRYIADEELAYVMTRYRQVHDFFHVLTNLPVNVLGEIGLKWFEAYQTGLPMTILASIFGPLRLNSRERQSLIRDLIPWAIRAGRSSSFLMNVYYEEHIEKEMKILLNELCLVPFTETTIF